MAEVGRRVIDRFQAKRADGTVVIIEEVAIKVQNPTSTGTLWRAPPMSYTILKLADGSGEVNDMEDGTYWVVNTGETLTRV